MSEFHVDHETLLQHSSRLGAVTDRLGSAADAARQVNLNDGAFGILCAFLPLVIGVFETTTGETIAASRETSTAMAEQVRAMAQDYARVDDAVATRLKSLGGGTGGGAA
jgi:hypothetical protein